MKLNFSRLVHKDPERFDDDERTWIIKSIGEKDECSRMKEQKEARSKESSAMQPLSEIRKLPSHK